jgi:uncharacterized membrane protein YebE (DUF533 family)
MKINKNITFAGLTAVTLLLTGCAGNPYMSNAQTADATGGALLGAVAGTVIGNQTGAGLAGAAIGAGIGGLAGAGMGNQQPPQYQQTYQQPQYQQQPGYYAPPVNNPQCPQGYTCVPTAPQYQQQYP